VKVSRLAAIAGAGRVVSFQIASFRVMLRGMLWARSQERLTRATEGGQTHF
jgi:hypothetical protein